MIAAIILFNALFGLVTCIVVLHANPRRRINQAFAAVFLLFALWLFCIYRLFVVVAEPHATLSDRLFWLRANTLVVAWVPLTMWWLKEVIVTMNHRTISLKRVSPWLLLGVVLVVLGLSDAAFTPLSTSDGTRGRGIAYFVFIAMEVVAYAVILAQAWRSLGQLSGVRHIELKFLVIVLGALGLSCSLLNGLGSYLNMRVLKLVQFPLIIASFALCAWSICVYRILSARDIIMAVVHRTTGISTAILGIVLMEWILQSRLSGSFTLPVSATIACCAAFLVDRRLHARLDLGGTRFLTHMRLTTSATARTEPNIERLVGMLETHLCKWCDCESAALLFREALPAGSGRFNEMVAWCKHEMLQIHGWVTPESLERRRNTPDSEGIHAFMRQNRLGLVIAVPPGVGQPTLILALEKKSDETPFTYPEIERLQNVAELMDNILTRSRLTEQAALQAKMEHLAMMSRGLAHDLKNLITPVSSFLVHTDHSFEPNSPAAEVHAAARRSVRIMNDYVRESLFFSERLAPKFELVDLARLFEAVRETTAPQAQRRGITIALRLEFTPPIVADAVLLQRMLANFVGNAIDASRPGKSVTLVASTPCDGWTHLQVIDEGCGIAPEHLGRVFDAYFTTKEFGDDVRGFGLGLSIAQKIADLHCGIINIESQVDIGTTITVELPVTQPTRLETRRLIAGAATP